MLRDRKGSVKMLYGLIAVPFAAYFGSGVIGLGVFIFVMAFFLGTLYITSMRADEYRSLIEDTTRELDAIEAALAESARPDEDAST